MKLRKPLRQYVLAHLRTWHRRLGITAAAFILFLSFSGIALNHADSWGLADRNVTWEFVLDWYGIKEPRRLGRTGIGHLSVVETDGLVWLPDGMALECGSLRGAAVLPGQALWAVLCGEQLILLDQAGELVDQLQANSGIPAQPVRLGTGQSRLVLETADGFYATVDTLSWHKLDDRPSGIQWGEIESLSATEEDAWRQKYRSRWLHWERVLMDLHSGRIWGSYGPWLSDVVAVLLILLSASGVYVWVRVYRKR